MSNLSPREKTGVATAIDQSIAVEKVLHQRTPTKYVKHCVFKLGTNQSRWWLNIKNRMFLIWQLDFGNLANQT